MPKFNLWRLGLLLVLLFCLLFHDAEAKRRRQKQGGKKKAKRGDFRNVKGKRIKNGKNKKYKPEPERNTPPTIEEEMEDMAAAEIDPFEDKKRRKKEGYFFEPYKELSIVSEDTSTIDEGETNIVEVEEEVKVDSTWLKYATYYSVWSSSRKNPYGDAFPLTESVTLVLYDSTEGHHFAMPQRHTHVTSGFGWRWNKPHQGVDLELDLGDSIRAAFDGIVRITGYNPSGYGNWVLLRHYNGLETIYGHMTHYVVEDGQLVKAGDLIGYGGSTGRSTGPHLHFETLYAGKAFDPREIFDFSTWTINSQYITLTPGTFGARAKYARKVIYHRIRGGETLRSIANKYGINVKALARLNGLKAKSRIRAGRRLRIG